MTLLDEFKALCKQFGYVLVPSRDDSPDFHDPMILIKYDNEVEKYLNRTIIPAEDNPYASFINCVAYDTKSKDFTLIIDSVPSKVKKFYLDDGRLVVITRQDGVHNTNDSSDPALSYSSYSIGYYVDKDSLQKIPFTVVVKASNMTAETFDAPLGVASGIVFAEWLLRRGCSYELVITPKA